MNGELSKEKELAASSEQDVQKEELNNSVSEETAASEKNDENLELSETSEAEMPDAAEEKSESEVEGNSEKKVCINCGNELEPDQKFCPKCGVNQEVGVEKISSVEEFNKQLAQKKKKKKIKILISLLSVIVVAGLAVGGKFAFTAIRHSAGISKANKAVESYKLDEIDYDSAIATVTKLKESKDTDVANHAADAQKTIEKLKVSKEHFEKGELYKGKKEYKNAITHYNAVIKEDPNYTVAQNAIKEIIPLWKELIPSEIDGLMKENKTDEANKIVKTFLDFAGEDKDISNIGKFIEAETFYAKGYLNSAKNIYKTLPEGLKVNGVTVKSRLDTLKKYDIFVRMCGKWQQTKHYMETKEVWTYSWDSWYSEGTTAERYLTVTCVINKDGTVTVSGNVQFLTYTNYSSIKSYLDRDVFDSDFSVKVSLPSNGQVSFKFSTGDFTKGGYRVTDNQTLLFGGKTFAHTFNMKYVYSQSCTEYYKSNTTYGNCVEKY